MCSDSNTGQTEGHDPCSLAILRERLAVSPREYGPYRDGTSGVAAIPHQVSGDSRWLALGPPPAQQKPRAITRQPVHRNTCSRILDLLDCSHVCRRVHNFTQFSFLETREEHPFHVCARRQSPEEARKWWRSRFYQGGCPVRGGIV